MTGPGKPKEVTGLGLYSATVTIDTTPLIAVTKMLSNTTDGVSETFYFSGTHGITTNPAEPTLPLVVKNISAPTPFSDLVMRGIGFRGGLMKTAGTWNVVV